MMNQNNQTRITDDSLLFQVVDSLIIASSLIVQVIMALYKRKLGNFNVRHNLGRSPLIRFPFSVYFNSS